MFNDQTELAEKRLLSTNKRIETGIEIKRFIVLFSNIWKKEAIYKANKMRKSADPQSTPTSALKKGEVKRFQIYWVCLLTR